MKLKKIPYYLLLMLLTLGASLIIGFLSFTGMFTLAPILSLAIGSFILSVAYEGEIYLQNIKGALNKLFKTDFLKNQLATASLLKQFENNAIDTKTEDCPQFFKDYEAQLKLLHKFGHKRLDKNSKKAKRQIEKTLKDMEKWYASELFSDETETQVLTVYERELRCWLTTSTQDKLRALYRPEDISQQDEIEEFLEINSETTDWMKSTPRSEAKTLFASRSISYNWVIAFSALSGLFMSVGITYLLVEASTLIPILAAISVSTLPAIIVPLAIICGAAYTFLIYNAVTDMIHNDTLRKWYYKIRDEFKQGITPRGIFIAVSAVVLLALTVALTICTAGTWWTVAKTAQPLFSWMSKMPSFIMGIINPILLGASQLIFNLQNTSESLEMIDEATRIKGNLFKKIAAGISDLYHHLRDNENWLQLINPFRLIIKLTLTPLRLLFFLGHLISIGVTADRVPGIPEIASAILGIISEGFEDMHYFVGDLLHNHHHHHKTKDLLKERFEEGHGHDHSADIPSRILNVLFAPLFAAAASWDYLATRAVTNTPQACGLLQVEQEGTALSFEQVNPSLQGESAVFLYKDKLYYANQRTEKVKKIELTEENRPQYERLKSKIASEHQFATDEELELISTLTGHHAHAPNQVLSFEKAWDKQKGQPPKEAVNIKSTAAKPSTNWQVEQSIHQINRYLEKHINKANINPELAAEKAAELQTFRYDLQQLQGATETDIRKRILFEAQKPVYSRPRFFSPTKVTTRTEDFLAELPERIRTVSAA